MYVPIKKCSTPLLQKRKGLSKLWMAQLVKSTTLEQSILQQRWDGAYSGGDPVCPRDTTQSNIHRGARRRRMPYPSARRRHHMYPRRQINPERREVWMDIQAERKNSVRGGVSGLSLEGSSSRGGALRKATRGCESDQGVAGKSHGAFERDPRWSKTWW